MQNCLILLAVATALSTSMVDRVRAHSLTLINCASGDQRSTLDYIQPGAVAAGVIMADAERARARANLVVQSSVVEMIAPGDDNAIVLVTKPPVRIERGDTTCVVFAGSVDAEPRNG